MKICIAQIKPSSGDIQRNIECHKTFIDLAVGNGADVIIFPELSITGYEPTLAQDLAMEVGDRRFDLFQELSDREQVVIGIGVPTRTDNRDEMDIHISMLLFQPHQPRLVYSKKYLHADEKPFFVGGKNISVLPVDNVKVGLAICYELSISNHAETAYKSGADMYVASVAKTASGVVQARERLAEIARGYGMPAFLANCVGVSDGVVNAGNSAVWNNKGELLAQLDSTREGVIIYDTATKICQVVAR